MPGQMVDASELICGSQLLHDKRSFSQRLIDCIHTNFLIPSSPDFASNARKVHVRCYPAHPLPFCPSLGTSPIFIPQIHLCTKGKYIPPVNSQGKSKINFYMNNKQSELVKLLNSYQFVYCFDSGTTSSFQNPPSVHILNGQNVHFHYETVES